MPGWISELLIMLGLAVVAFALIGGSRFYDFFYGVQYVVIRLDRNTMLLVGGILTAVGLFLRAGDPRPRKRSRGTHAGS